MEEIQCSFLKEATIADVVKDGKKKQGPSSLITFPPHTTLDEASNILAQNHILSAPVFDESAQQYIGQIDIFDVMKFAVFGPVFRDPSKEKDYFNFKSNKFSQMKVTDLLSNIRAQRKKIFIVNSSQPLATLLPAFRSGVYRVLVRSAEEFHVVVKSYSEPLNLLSQMDTIRFLYQNMDKMGQVLEKKVEDFGFIKQVVSMNIGQTALEGFRRMYKEDLNALAVVDMEGKLIANLSASDIRGITGATISLVFEFVLDFLKKQHGEIRSVVTCTRQETIKAVLCKLVEQKVHRVWITDEGEKPIGLVTLTNILEIV